MERTFVNNWSDYQHFGMKAYRIWLMETVHGWFQRHEWQRTDGSTLLQDWIPTNATPDDRYKQAPGYGSDDERDIRAEWV